MTQHAHMETQYLKNWSLRDQEEEFRHSKGPTAQMKTMRKIEILIYIFLQWVCFNDIYIIIE